MNDLQRVITSLEKRNEPCVMATVVHTEGSTYRRAGARMVIFRDSSSEGAISGGCLESDVIESSTSVFDNGVPKLLRYDALSDDDDPIFGLGMGCNGVTTVFLERLNGNDDIFCETIRSLFNNRQSAVIATVYDIQSHNALPNLPLLDGHRLFLFSGDEANDNFGENPLAVRLRENVWNTALPLLSGGKPQQLTVDDEQARISLVLEPVQPLQELLVWGAGYDAIPLAHYASMLGWRVTIADHRPAYLSEERFGENARLMRTRRETIQETAQNLASKDIHRNTAVVIMTHNLALDAAALQAALGSEAGYIGLLGPKPRLTKILTLLREQGFAPTKAALQRLHSPIGLDIGSETAEEVALSIVSEIQAVMNTRSAGFLTKRKQGKIHE